MSDCIVKGPSDNSNLPVQSIGTIFYNEMKRKNPNKIAMIDGETGEQINCRKLLKVTVQLATQLRQMNVKKGDVISIVSENNWKYLATIIAGLYVGAKINLLNPDYTPRELKHFFSTCSPDVLFCSSKSSGKIQTLKDELFFPKTIIAFDSELSDQIIFFDNLLKETDESFIPTKVNPEEDVAIIPTSSGTTGLPKCVLLTHANLRIPFIHFGDPVFMGFKKDDLTIGNLPFFHIWGNIIALSSLFYNVTLIILTKFKPDLFLSTIENYKVTKLFTVPPILLFLAKSPLVDKYNISSIQDVICAAAVITKELEEMIMNRLNLKCVRQLYGMTEASLGITISPMNVVKLGSVGKVVTACEIKVCNAETGVSLGPNQVGELRLKGKGLMMGYLRNPEANAEAFDNDGYLKTGDLGYYDEEGFFYIVDRLKDIIKYKGFQVSPAEIEYLLIQHPAVKDAGVIGIPDEATGEVALAFVVKQPGKDVVKEELISYIDDKVSVQKRLYGGVRFVDEIPKTSSGKIWRRKLKDLL